MAPGQDVPVSFTDETGRVTTLTLVRGIESRLENLHRCATWMRDWHKRKFCGAERPEHVRLQDSRWGVLNVGDGGWEEPDDYEQRPLAVQAYPEFRVGNRLGRFHRNTAALGLREGVVKKVFEIPQFVVRGCEGALLVLKARWPDLFSTVFSNGPYVHSEAVVHNEDYRDNTNVFGGYGEGLTAFMVVGSWINGSSLPIGQMDQGSAYRDGQGRCECLFTPNEFACLEEFRDELYMTAMAPTYRTALVVGACMGWEEMCDGRNIFSVGECQDAWVKWMIEGDGPLWMLACMAVTGRLTGPALRLSAHDLWRTLATVDPQVVHVIPPSGNGLALFEAPAPARTNHAIRLLADRFKTVMRLKGVKTYA